MSAMKFAAIAAFVPSLALAMPAPQWNATTSAPVTKAAAASTVYKTEVVTALTTYCPSSTQVTHNGVTYTVTSASTLTITDCPCTLTHTSVVAPTGTAASASTFACNPAHSYPQQVCTEIDGQLTLVPGTLSPSAPVSKATSIVTPATTSAAVQTFACNPAHSYPQQVCTEINGQLTLVPGTLSPSAPTTTPAPAVSASTDACNPAHFYPSSVCTEISGQLTLVPGSLSPSASVPATTPAAAVSASTFACNPAHSYPSSVCVEQNGQLTLVPGTLSPSAPVAMATTLPASMSAASTPVAALPALAQSAPASAPAQLASMVASPAVQFCAPVTVTLPAITTTVTVVAPTSAVSTAVVPPPAALTSAKSSVAPPPPAESLTTVPAVPLPSPISVSTKPLTSFSNSTVTRTLTSTKPTTATATLSSASATTPAPAPLNTAGATNCPLDLPTNFEYPHLIEINGVNGYFGQVDATHNTTIAFDIPASDAGKTCNTYFILPSKSQLVTSDYTLSGTGKVHFTKGGKEVAAFAPIVDGKFLVASEKCQAGQRVTYEMTADAGMALRWFNDWNACALGLFTVHV